MAKKNDAGRNPPGQSPKEENQVLLMLNKDTNEIRVVTGDKESKEPKPKPEPLEQTTESQFFTFDRFGSWIENFLKNFVRQVKNPTHFNLITMGVEELQSEKTRKTLQDLSEGKNNRNTRQFLKKHEYRPGLLEEINNNLKNLIRMSEQQMKYTDAMIDWQGIGKDTNVTKEYLKNQGVYDSMMMGWNSNILIPVETRMPGVATIRGEYVLSFRPDSDGSISLNARGVKPFPDLNRPLFGQHMCTQEDRKKLAEDKNLGRVIDLRTSSGEVKPCYVSFHKLTNEPFYCPVDEVYIPKVINNVALDATEYEHLKNGGKVFLEGMQGQKGEFDAWVQVSAAVRRIDYAFENGGLFNSKKICGVELSDQQYADLNDFKTILVEGMTSKNHPKRAPYDRFVTLNKDTGKHQLTKYNPQQPVGERDIVIPYAIGEVLLSKEERADLKNGQEIFLTDVKDARGDVSNKYVAMDMTTGEILKSNYPNIEGGKIQDVPKKLFNHTYTAPERAKLQDFETILIKGIKGRDGTKMDLYVSRDEKTGRITTSKNPPSQKMSGAQNREQKQDKPKRVPRLG